MEKPTFMMLVGPSGSGKSTFAKRFAATHKDYVWLSSDCIRQELWGDEADQRRPDMVFERMELRTLLTLMRGMSVIYDATNLNRRMRIKMIKFLNQHFANVVRKVCYYWDLDLQTCVDRQHSRDRKVPREVIVRQFKHYQEPDREEGWDEVTRVVGE